MTNPLRSLVRLACVLALFVSLDPREVDVNLVQGRAAQLSVALGLALRKDREKRA